MTVEAGLILQEAHRVAEAAGAIFPLWLATQGSARIGGCCRSNAGGVQVLAFGNARELTLGVEAVLADGRLYQGLNSLKKDNTGYDLDGPPGRGRRDARVHHGGDGGTLPEARGAGDGDRQRGVPEAALDLFYLLRERTGSRLTAFELMPRFGDRPAAQARHARAGSDGAALALVCADRGQPR